MKSENLSGEDEQCTFAEIYRMHFEAYTIHIIT